MCEYGGVVVTYKMLVPLLATRPHVPFDVKDVFDPQSQRELDFGQPLYDRELALACNLLRTVSVTK
jgi:hypothetical protein